jgi:hypothetical protein
MQRGNVYDKRLQNPDHCSECNSFIDLVEPFLLLLLPIPRTEIILLGILDLHGSDNFGLVFPHKGKDAVRSLEKMGRNSDFLGITQLIPSRLIGTTFQ